MYLANLEEKYVFKIFNFLTCSQNTQKQLCCSRKARHFLSHLRGKSGHYCYDTTQHSHIYGTNLAQKGSFFCWFSFVCFVLWPHLSHVGSQFLDQGPNPQSVQWKHRVLNTGPPGTSQQGSFTCFLPLFPLVSKSIFTFPVPFHFQAP